jgi:tetratricopeptide (TPR) repeat protein
MADEDDSAAGPQGGTNANDPVAAGLALNAASPEAREYLRKQGLLADKHVHLANLQIDTLQKQDEYETSHLRWRRFNDQMKGALQIMLVLVGALIVIGIGTAMWNASQADGLVVDAFSVPQSFAAHGISGDVVAEDFTSKLASIHNSANGFSAASDVSRDHANDLSVDIPDTGVSVATVWRVLRAWLGHEQHLNGSLREVGGGKLVFTTTLDNGTAISASGSALDALEQQEAEKVFCATDSTSCANYLLGHNRWTELAAEMQFELTSARTPEEIALAYSIGGALRGALQHDYYGGLAMVRTGLAYAPKLANAQVQLLALDQYLGHTEDMLAVARQIAADKESDQTKRIRGDGFARIRFNASQEAAFWRRDFGPQEQLVCYGECTSADDFVSRAYTAMLLHDAAQHRALIARASLLGRVAPVFIADSETLEHLQMGDWAAAAAAARRGIKDNESEANLWGRLFSQEDQDGLTTELAAAQAHLGDVAGAHATLSAMRSDCYICVDGRADVEAIARNWAAADTMFKRATEQAPSVPIAYTNWGQMLLQKGDLDGAITKFTTANQKSPHFADPLEMWGEALIAKNRSDLALAKFEEANKYAPHWGRLHLKWGEALVWSGDKSGAQKQFAIAAGLDLTPPEKYEVAKVSHGR